MKKIFALLTVLFAVTGQAHAAAKVGDAAPAFKGTDTNGKEVSLSDYKGKIVVLEWKNHECPFVVKHYSTQNMQKLQNWATGAGVVWLSVVSSAEGKQGNVTPEEANKIIEKEGSHASAVILDPTGEIGKAYGASTTPHMFVIGKDGKLVYAGAIDDKPSADKEDVDTAKNYVRQAVEELMAGKAVSEPVSQPYGCGVKY